MYPHIPDLNFNAILPDTFWKGNVFPGTHHLCQIPLPLRVVGFLDKDSKVALYDHFSVQTSDFLKHTSSLASLLFERYSERCKSWQNLLANLKSTHPKAPSNT